MSNLAIPKEIANLRLNLSQSWENYANIDKHANMYIFKVKQISFNSLNVCKCVPFNLSNS